LISLGASPNKFDAGMTPGHLAALRGVEARTVMRWEAHGDEEAPVAKWARRTPGTFAACGRVKKQRIAITCRDDGWRRAWADIFTF
jgi:hypothetical protein